MSTDVEKVFACPLASRPRSASQEQLAWSRRNFEPRRKIEGTVVDDTAEILSRDDRYTDIWYTVYVL